MSTTGAADGLTLAFTDSFTCKLAHTILLRHVPKIQIKEFKPLLNGRMKSHSFM